MKPYLFHGGKNGVEGSLASRQGDGLRSIETICGARTNAKHTERQRIREIYVSDRDANPEFLCTVFARKWKNIRPPPSSVPCPPTCRSPIWPIARLEPTAIPFEDRCPFPRLSRPSASLSLTGPKT